MEILSLILSVWWIGLIIAIIIFHKFVFRIFGIVIIPEDSIGVVNKKFILGKKTLPDGAIIALNGEAGYQAETLASGMHKWLWPWQFNVDIQKFTIIRDGYVGVVQANDGHALHSGRVLAKKVECNTYQNARLFIENGGQRGPQIDIIPPGSWRINRALFTVSEHPVIEIEDNKVGVVTTMDGMPLKTGEIAGKEINDHNSFQDGETFITNGGYKGLQEQVILAGRYMINPNFCTVEIKDMTTVPIANVGVIIAYVGNIGADVTGDKFKHGNLVEKGSKGVCDVPLDPGKYPINPYTHKIELVPTANVVLNWANSKNESHQLDKNLSTITVRSYDGFTFNLDVSQIIHIPRNDAPRVIARFGSVANLVTQVLEPTIGNYFRNAAQSSDVIEFLQKRKERQTEAKNSIQSALNEYNVGAVDTLIGDITPPQELMKTLTDRKLAEQEKITFETQKGAQEIRKDLEQAKAIADTQKIVVDAERTVQIKGFEAEAKIKEATGDAQSKTINASADAEVIKTVGLSQAETNLAIGTSESEVIKLKINSIGNENYSKIEVAKYLSKSGFKLVPDIVAGGTKGSSIMDILMADFLKEKIK